MRQTSQAVLLLISGAAAVEAAVNPFLAGNTGTIAARTTLTQGDIAAVDFGRPVYQAATFFTTTTVAATSGNTGLSTESTQSCMDCMRTKASAALTGAITGVWCSAAWNYEYTLLLAANVYPKATSAALTFAADGGVATVGQTGDMGSCCYTQAVYVAVSVVPVGTAASKQDTTNGALDKLNKWTCPAKFSNDYGANTVKINDPANSGANNQLKFVTATSWWCSDTSYNLTTAAGTSTPGATASLFKATKAGLIAAASGTNDIIPGYDRRLDLFFAACRQKKLLCGAGMVENLTTTAVTRTPVQHATAGFSSSEKCTWTMMSTTKAPTFSVLNAASLSANFDIMYQEWVDGWQLNVNVDFQPMTAARKMNGIVYPHILGTQYAKVAKYNYAAANSGNVQDVFGATNNGQSSGMAYTFVNINAGGATGPACASVATLAGASDVPANCWAARVKRWFTASDATAGVVGASAQKAEYDSKKTAFNTAATAYNTYLADLKTANEKDAFAAFFAPPTKPAFVKRPATPWMPAAYTGMQHWTSAKQQKLWDKLAGSDPAANEFILANKANAPGWGNWTIARLNLGTTVNSVNTLWHSFGMVGTTASKAGTHVNTMSYLKAWGQIDDLSEGAASTALQLRASTNASGSVMCQSTTASDACLKLDAATGTKAIKNLKNVYLSVSLWATGTTAVATGAYNTAAAGVVVSFYGSDWANTSNYYAPAAASAGTTLTEPAAAQALAASAAAVLAVAAALY